MYAYTFPKDLNIGQVYIWPKWDSQQDISSLINKVDISVNAKTAENWKL